MAAQAFVYVILRERVDAKSGPYNLVAAYLTDTEAREAISATGKAAKVNGATWTEVHNTSWRLEFNGDTEFVHILEVEARNGLASLALLAQADMIELNCHTSEGD